MPVRFSIKTLFANASLVLCSLLFTFVLAEVVLWSVGNAGSVPTKLRVNVRGDVALCYPSDPDNKFDLDLRRSEDWERMMAITKESDPSSYLAKIRDISPHCILHSARERRRGHYPGRERSIAVVGDSFPFGEGVPVEDSLGSLLGERFSDFNFPVYATPGANIPHIPNQLANAIKEISDLEGVIYFYNLNDTTMSKKTRRLGSTVVTFQHVWVKNIQEQDNYFGSKLLKKSRLLSLVEQWWLIQAETERTVAFYHDRYFGENNRDELAATLNEILKMKALAEQHNIDFYLAVYPLLHKDNYGNYPFADIHELLENFAKESSIDFIDLYPPFDRYYSLKKFGVHAVDLHPNGNANREVVDYLFDSGFLKNKLSRN